MCKNKELLKEQLESFKNDLNIMNSEISKIHYKLNEDKIKNDQEIYEFWISKMSNFLTSRKQVQNFIKEIENKLKEGDEVDKHSDEE